MPLRPLEGRIALVTGGGSGIGAETCAELARLGADVVVNGREAGPVDAVVARCEDLGVRARAALGSVDDPSDVERVVGVAVDGLGGLSIVVNNAGVQQETPFLDLDLATWRQQLAVDLDGAFLVASAGARHMAGRGGGVVVNVTSVHEHQPRPGFAAYCVAKAGLGMLTQVMARELAPHGIRVVSVAPGAVETAMQGEQSPAERDEQLDGIPVGRLAHPGEVASVIGFLCGPGASYVSGSSVVVDGALMTQVSLS